MALMALMTICQPNGLRTAREIGLTTGTNTQLSGMAPSITNSRSRVFP